ncbi:hypothetical protein HOC01_03725 [archaeon]|jgi:hypothetical protein|nr:hypothetical protein [archaeon]MBT4604723.1 hypothetical protein [archaeon]MBT6698479.1 hypothetical protein [archaeon]
MQQNTLDIVGEIHPTNVLRTIISLVDLKRYDLSTLANNFIRINNNEPHLFADESQLDQWAKYLIGKIDFSDEKVVEKMKAELICPDEPEFDLEKEIATQMRFVARMFSEEFELITSRGYNLLFTEGSSLTLNPLGEYAKNKGLDLVYLDNDFLPYTLIQHDRLMGIDRSLSDIEQQDRELHWLVDKVFPSKADLGSALMVVGQNHVDDKFGLIQRLNHYGVSYNVVFRGKEILNQVRRQDR